MSNPECVELSGSVGRVLDWDQRVACLSITTGQSRCVVSLAKALYLVQPRTTRHIVDWDVKIKTIKIIQSVQLNYHCLFFGPPFYANRPIRYPNWILKKI